MNRRMALLTVAFAWLAGCPRCNHEPEVIYYRFTPMVVPETSLADVTVEARIAHGPVEVRLALESTGSEVQLMDDGLGVDAAAGDGIYSRALSASDVLHDFAVDDVNRNLVGRLRLYRGNTQIGPQGSLFVDVLTADVPAVPVTAISPTIQYSQHLVNVVDPMFFTSFRLESVAQAFYAEFPDDYDFLAIVYEIPHREERNHRRVQNNVANIGLPIHGNPGAWGSAARLLGRIEFPIPTMFDGASVAYVHELGHQWVNHLSLPPFDRAEPHWPLSDLASGIMGWGKGRYTEGLNFPFDLVPSGPDYLLSLNNEPKVYSDLSLYLMGLAAADEVSDHFVFDDQNQTPSRGGTMVGPVTTVTINDVISVMGPRIADHSEAPKKFRVATILVSRDRLVSADVMRLYDHFSVRAEATEIVSVADGLAKFQSNPFYLATGGRAELDSQIIE